MPHSSIEYLYMINLNQRFPLPGGKPRKLMKCMIALMLVAGVSGLSAGEPVVGRPLPPWQEGMLEIHDINTGRGDSTFFIFPDGTTLLLDAGDKEPRTTWSDGRPRLPNYDSPSVPNESRRAGEWIARYIRNVHPRGPEGNLDYAMLTHFHADHMGGIEGGSFPDGIPWNSSRSYRLLGITEVGEKIRIERMIDRGWPDYGYPRPLTDEMMINYRAFLRRQVAERGMQVERFQPGRNDQIVLRHAARRYPSFEIRNIAADGRIWTGGGTETRARFPASDPPTENNCSLAFRLRYGKFTYFNGGDMVGEISPSTPAWRDMESALAWVVGPVDVHALNHHGFKDAANRFFLSVLQPRVHLISVYASSQPGPEVLRRMLSTNVFPGPRDVFMTNGMWPGRRENMVALFGEKDAAWLTEEIGSRASQGHTVVRVAPGGERYHVLKLDDRNESRTILSVHGPYTSTGVQSAVSAGGHGRKAD
jgi:hypothetical protein